MIDKIVVTSMRADLHTPCQRRNRPNLYIYCHPAAKPRHPIYKKLPRAEKREAVRRPEFVSVWFSKRLFELP